VAPARWAIPRRACADGWLAGAQDETLVSVGTQTLDALSMASDAVKGGALAFIETALASSDWKVIHAGALAAAATCGPVCGCRRVW
jgi:hypothetical protein